MYLNMKINLRGALAAFLILCVGFIAGCGGGGGETPAANANIASSTEPAQTNPTPSPSPNPVVTTGSIKLELDTSQQVVQRASRVVVYFHESALNYEGDPWSQGFNPNRVVFGPVERSLADFSASPNQNPSTTWTKVPAGHHQGEAWLFSENGYRIARYVFTVDIVAGQVTTLSRVNWADESDRAISMPVRPITWVHNGQQPQFDGLAETRWEITGMDALVCADSLVQPSVRLVDRNTATMYAVNRSSNTPIGSQITVPNLFGATLTAITTMAPWSHYVAYLGTNGKGIDRYGTGYPDLSTNFDGVTIVDLDGAAERVITLYQSIQPVGFERDRICVTSTQPYNVEAEFEVRDLLGNATTVEAEPGLERIWVGTEVGDLGCFDRTGNRITLIPFTDGPDQNPRIADLAMVDDRYLAVALEDAGLVRFIDTRTGNVMTSVVSIPGVTQIASVEGDTYLAAVARYATGETYLQWHKRVQLP